MKHSVPELEDTEPTTSTATGRHSHKDNSARKEDLARNANMDPQEMQRKMEEAGKPGPAHQALEALVGNWEAEVKCWMDPDGAPQITEGTARAKWILNGRFLEEEFHGEMMGKPFSGLTIMGYDNTKQTLSTAWVSDMQTSMFTSEGRADSGFKVFTLEGKSTCPGTGQKDQTIRTVLRILNRDKRVLEMYDVSQANRKTMEITYTRQ